MSAASSSPVVHPRPEVVARTASAEEIPKTAKGLHDLAVANGFAAWITYARGTRLGASKVTDSIAVRMHRGDTRLVGLWIDGSFSTGLRSSPMAVLNSKQLTAVVTG